MKNTTTLRITVRVPARSVARPHATPASNKRPRALAAVGLAAGALAVAGAAHWLRPPARIVPPTASIASHGPVLAQPAGSGLASSREAADLIAPVAPDVAARCADAFAARRWRAAVDDCTAAAQARPEAPDPALKVAHALFARDRAADARLWAERALALGSPDPDAHVLIGYAARAAGDHTTARTAFRAYLRLAPRGWHAPRVRAWLAPPANENEQAVDEGATTAPTEDPLTTSAAP